LTISTPSGYDWQGDGNSETVNTCSSGTCSTSSWNYVETVGLTVNATKIASGSTQTVTVTGCGTTLSSFSGNNATHSLTLDASCNLTLGIPAGYIWIVNGTTVGNSTVLTSCLTGTCSPSTVDYTKAHPFIAGYQTGNHWQVKAVMATFSYDGTPQSDIPSGNHLYAGIYGYGSSSNITGKDYGYQASLVYPSSGSIYLVAQVDIMCEGFLTSACHPTYFHIVESYSDTTPSISASDNVTLEMRFSGHTVTWYYDIDSNGNYSFYSYTPPSDSAHSLSVGTVVFAPLGIPLTGTAKYFQFGVSSDSPIGNTGWKLLIHDPEYLNSSATSFALVPHAKSVQGTNSWIDYAWVWGGENFRNVGACYADNGSCSRSSDDLLLESSASTLSDGTSLW
jgi:hypothetical protein